MKFLLLMVMLAECAATPRDLSGLMFTFPEQTDTARVGLSTSTQSFSSVTVCLRFFTDLRRGYPLFSLATTAGDNDFLMFFKTETDEIHFWVRNHQMNFFGQGAKLNTWHSICSTWDSVSGLGQVWLNGNPTVRKFASSGSHISGPLSIILGQEQDSFAGSFDTNQCFTGMISDVHMWDHILSPGEIMYYVEELNFTPGNVLNWKALEFQVTGRVLLESKGTSIRKNI